MIKSDLMDVFYPDPCLRGSSRLLSGLYECWLGYGASGHGYFADGCVIPIKECDDEVPGGSSRLGGIGLYGLFF